MISVITPAYNAEQFIAQAIDSVYAQGIDDWEMIIVDDGSTDRTVEIIEGYAAKDSRIKLIKNQHQGVSKARNSGLQFAQYEWIALLDADDVFLAGRLTKQLEAASKYPDVVLWASYAYNAGVNGVVYDLSPGGPTNHEEFRALRQRGEVIQLKTSSTLFRRELALKLNGFDSKYDSTEDAELWNRMAEYGPVIVIPEPLVLYRYHPNSLSVRKMEFQYACARFIYARNLKRLRGEDLELEDFMASYGSRNIFRKILDFMMLRSTTYWRNAGIMLANHQKIKGLYWICMAFLTNPFMIGWRIFNKIVLRLSKPKAV